MYYDIDMSTPQPVSQEVTNTRGSNKAMLPPITTGKALGSIQKKAQTPIKQQTVNLAGLPKQGRGEIDTAKSRILFKSSKSKSSYPLSSRVTRRLTLYTATPPDQIK